MSSLDAMFNNFEGLFKGIAVPVDPKAQSPKPPADEIPPSNPELGTD